ncbi:hypothetical protein M493_15450 [Geobacillus genomosp. 3]|uniref:Uncharacterized protein n=1 Tax=Geobacillus genomosp. 3 TaxID=1921421 RepID=S6A3R5_GEOG3|nr:hypothetical protein M493_15450 [Geobacillus genomosp. 3]
MPPGRERTFVRRFPSPRRDKSGYCLYMTAGAKKADEHFSLYDGLFYDMIHIYKKRLFQRNR